MAVNYKLKAIKFFERDVPIVIQNENGPCPLIALANVLLLRNQIKLSVDCSEINQERLLALIAGFLLDSNNPERLGASDADLQANLQKNMADAVEMLPKLTTGLDVNLFFHDIRGFEFTDVVAIFDLLDIQLVHGWLVDPQDKRTVGCINGMSYNALIERLLALSGSAAPAAISEPTGTGAPSGASATSQPAGSNNNEAPEEASASAKFKPAESELPAETAAKEAKPAPEEPVAGDDAEEDVLGPEYDVDMQAALELSMCQMSTGSAAGAQQSEPQAADGAAQEQAVARKPVAAEDGGSAAAAEAEDFVVVGHPEGTVLMDAATEHTPSEMPASAELPAELSSDICEEPHAHVQQTQPDAEHQHNASANPAPIPPALATQPREAPAQIAVPAATAERSTEENAAGDRAAPEQAQVPEGAPAPDQAAPTGGSEPAAAVAAAGVPGADQAGGSEPEEATGVGEAYVIQAFLAHTSSQLTEHGLVSLHAGLKPNQLAVLFRNNHFNTLFKFQDALYLLVTDLGYLHERDVVWERLDAIDGDTIFVTNTLKPPEPVDAQSAEEQESASLALALQLHQEEQEAAERRRQEQRAQQQQQQPPPSAQPPAQGSQGGQPEQPPSYGHRHRHWRHQRPSHGGARPSRPKQDNCSLM